MINISGPQGSKGPSQPMLDEGGRPFQRRTWELAVARIAQCYIESDEAAPPDLEKIKVTASQSLNESDTARLNRLIEKLWNESAAQPSGSHDSLIETVYLRAIDRFAQRFELPAMQGPSLPVEQAWLLVRAGDFGDEAALPMEAVAAELQEKMPEGSASRLKALAQDPACSAANLQRLVRMVGDLVRAAPVPVAELQAVLDQPTVERALQKGARAHSAQLLDRMGVEVEKAINGEPMQRMPGGFAQETRAEFEKNWGALKAQVQGNQGFKVHNQALTEDGRALLYNLYITRLEQAWGHFRQAEPWRVLETLAEFLENCETGWDQQISQLLEQIPGRAPAVLQPLLQARDERRGELDRQLVSSHLGTNVHYERALRQQLNNRLALGFTQEQLGDSEEEGVQALVRPTAQAIVGVVDPANPQEQARRSREFIQTTWNSLGEAEQEQVQQALRAFLHDGLERGAEPYFLPTKDLERIQQYQKAIREAIDEPATDTEARANRVFALLQSPPLSMTAIDLLFPEDLDPLRVQARSSDWAGLSRLVEGLVMKAELRAFDDAVKGEPGSELLRALWAGVLGLGSFEEPAFKHLCEGLRPVDVSAGAQRVMEETIPAVRAAQIHQWIDLFVRNGYQAVPEDAWQDREFVLAVVRRNGTALQYASEALHNDREIVMAAIFQDYRSLAHASSDLKASREFVLEVVRLNGFSLQYAAEDLKKDLEIVLTAVGRSGAYVLLCVPEERRADRGFVLAMITEDSGALAFASEELQASREFVLEVVRLNGFSLHYAREALRNDHELVWAAVQQNGLALEYASTALQNDRAIVLTAVQQNGRALQYASEALRNDREFMLAAVQQDGLTLEYASEQMRADPEMVLLAVKQDARAFHWASEELQRDLRFNLQAAKTNGMVLEYLRHKGYRDIVLAAVLQNGLALEHAGAYRWDQDIALAAARQNVEAILHASTTLHADPMFIMQVAGLSNEAERLVRERLHIDPGLAPERLRNQGIVGMFRLALFRAQGLLQFFRR